MERISLFDLLSFILPGGTLIILVYLLFENYLGINQGSMPGESIMIVPFLFISYLVGHLISILGKFLESWLLRLKTPWVIYLRNNHEDALLIDSLCQNYFGFGIFDNEKNEIHIGKSDKLFDKIYDLLDAERKDEKIKVLMSQYAMFRNSTSIWFITLFFALLLLCLSFLGQAISIDKTTLGILLFTDILLMIASMWLLKKRKLLMMEYTYRTFLAINNHKIN
jgi:hypothetical protein